MNTRKLKDPDGLPCPSDECTSSDGYKINDKTGWGHCFVCGMNHKEDNTITEPLSKEPVDVSGIAPLPDYYRQFNSRGLTEETIKRYKVTVSKDGKEFLAKYPMFEPGTDKHVMNKTRMPATANMRFLVEGDQQRAGLFGRHAFPPGSAKQITVTEGYDDAMAAHQMTGNKYPCVSVHSAATAEQDIRRDFEYLNSFDTIVICFDNDEAGLRAAKKAASIGFPLGKIKVLSLRKHKDANDYLLAKESDKFTAEWWQAPVVKPDGLKLGSEMWQSIIERKDHFSTEYPFEGLNKLTYGIRLSEMVILTADTGVGKTAVLKHIEHLLLTNPEVVEKNYGVGFLHLEEPNGDTALGLLSIHNRTPYHLPDVDRPEEDLRKAFDEVLNNERVVIWDHFGSNSVDAILDKVRHMVALGCKFIVLDHLSIVVSDQSGDERKQLDEIATKLKTLTMELDIAVIAVIHTNRQGQIRGTAGVEQLANIVLRLERDKTDDNEWRRNVTKLTVEKNRFCGYTGPACWMWYNKNTARLMELSPEDAAIYEQGGFLNDDAQGF